jgi:hypothetical protein
MNGATLNAGITTVTRGDPAALSFGSGSGVLLMALLIDLQDSKRTSSFEFRKLHWASTSRPGMALDGWNQDPGVFGTKGMKSAHVVSGPQFGGLAATPAKLEFPAHISGQNSKSLIYNELHNLTEYFFCSIRVVQRRHETCLIPGQAAMTVASTIDFFALVL